jgi:hypothetical protein
MQTSSDSFLIHPSWTAGTFPLRNYNFSIYLSWTQWYVPLAEPIYIFLHSAQRTLVPRAPITSLCAVFFGLVPRFLAPCKPLAHLRHLHMQPVCSLHFDLLGLLPAFYAPCKPHALVTICHRHVSAHKHTTPQSLLSMLQSLQTCYAFTTLKIC